MKPLRVVLLCSTTVLSTSCISSYQFPDHGARTPDWQTLEQARDALAVDENFNGELSDFLWLPLLTMQFKEYGPSDPLLLAGSTLTEMEAYGPMVMFSGIDRWSFDEQGQLYERYEGSNALWLWENQETRVRVPSGWRIDSETSLLLGLLHWSTTVYVSE